MKAAVLDSGKTILAIRDVPDTKPGYGEVKVAIKACGICGSDVHLVAHGTLKCRHYPRVPGHESSGVISQLGEGVEDYAVGDRVVIAAGTCCGKCTHCLSGRENFCKEIGVFGFDRDGSFADSLVVESRYLYKLPEEIPFEEGAILADAVSTPYNAIKYRGMIQESDTVAIIGCGGLGIHGVAIARALTKAKVIAMDIDAGSLENALAYGADEIINISQVRNAGKTLKDISKGVDLLVDFSGYMKNVEDSVRAMNTGGRIVLVGIGRQPLSFQIPFILIEKMISIVGSYGSDHRSIPDLIQMYLDKKINLKPSITGIHPLSEINDCINDLDHRVGNPIRFIINPSL